MAPGLVYYTIKRINEIEPMIRRINFEQGLTSLYSLGEPIHLGGNYRIFVMRSPKKNLTVKVEGPQEVIYRFINEVSPKLGMGLRTK